MSTLMPAVDALLGIEVSSAKLKSALEHFEKSMPKSHRTFLTQAQASATVRMRLLLSKPLAGQHDEMHDSLVKPGSLGPISLKTQDSMFGKY